jgi:outer membrane protein assembly factor BamA
MLQQLSFRLGKSNLFAGMNYKIFSATAKADTPLPPPAGDGVEVQSGGASGILEYDSRDNIFTPNRGLSSRVEWTHFDRWLGSDNQFDLLALKNRYWVPFTESLVLGVRGDGFFSGGDVPFYMLPFVQIRGIPAMRHQGKHVLVTEMELRWDFTRRWSLVGFAGAGWTGWDDFSDLGNSETYPAGGFGFRYLVARMFNLRMGIDIGFSEEDSSIYFTTGTAWML